MSPLFVYVWPQSENLLTSGFQRVVFTPVAFLCRKGIELGKKYTILYRKEIFSVGLGLSALVVLYAAIMRITALFLLAIGSMIVFAIAFWAYRTQEKEAADCLGEQDRTLYNVLVQFGGSADMLEPLSFQQKIEALRNTLNGTAVEIANLKELADKLPQEIEKNQSLLQKLTELQEVSRQIAEELAKLERRGGARHF